MSVTIEQPGGPDGTLYRITAEPDSGKAYWQKDVNLNWSRKDPWYPVLLVLRRAMKIDYEFSLDAIEGRKTRRENAARRLREHIQSITPSPTPQGETIP